MGNGETKNYGFLPVVNPNLPLDQNLKFTEDVYIFLPKIRGYVVFVSKGEKYSHLKQAALAKHAVPVLFVRQQHGTDPSAMDSAGTKRSIMEKSWLFSQGGSKLNDICHQIFELTEQPSAEVLTQLESFSDTILETVAPESKKLRDQFKDHQSYLWLMNDASAIASIGVICAMANSLGVDNRNHLRDLVRAAVVMDFPLMKLGEDILEQYYRLGPDMDPELWEKVKSHPSDAYLMAKQKLKNFTDITYELINCHHELYNGTGYPRKVRSTNLPLMVQCFALAVDIFEKLKRATLVDQEVKLKDVLLSLQEPDVEPHKRRHSIQIVTAVLDFLEDGNK